MTPIRRAWWAALVLAAVAGCNTEESAPVDTTAPASPAVPAPSPTVTTPDPMAPPSGEMKGAPAPDAPVGDAAPKVDAPSVDAPKDDAPKAAAVSFSDEEIAAIKQLPASEQTLAMKQIVCPVSDGNLGAMGKPLKVTAKGKTFYLCCDKCEAEVKSDPDAVLAKLKK